MSTKLSTPREIERWVPAHLGQVVGCDELKAHFADQLRLDGCGVNTFIAGEPGSGKTATVKAFSRSLLCPNLSPTTLLPCGECGTCRNFDVRYRESGMFALLQERVFHGAEPINFYPVNCGEVVESTLRSILDDRVQYGGRFIIYLDECHRLVRRKMEHLLLKPLEELDVLWIASTALPGELDPMSLRRFAAKISTSPPTQTDLVSFMDQRCREWSIDVDRPSTLDLLARRSRLVPARAINVIALAAGKPGRRLTKEDVAGYPFD